MPSLLAVGRTILDDTQVRDIEQREGMEDDPNPKHGRLKRSRQEV